MNQPLAGIRVLDLTRLLPSGVATQMLADMGADVIKIEDPNGGDYARWMGPAIDDSSVFFRMNNRSKRSLILNLKADEGAGVLKRLVKHADVLVESFRPGVMAKFGCDYDALRAENPKLIYCAISGWGATGPYAPFANHDIN
ncbi:MAG: carnitine dehydratase, partial [Phototrophicales bacterium]